MSARRYGSLFFVLLAISWPGWVAAEVADPPEPSELLLQQTEGRAEWVRRFQEASSLLGAGKVAEALAGFESLQADLPDLDTDGLVAVAIGDCRFNLKQYEPARQAYSKAQAEHPNLTEYLWARRVEIDIAAGNPAARATLRQVVDGATGDGKRHWAALRLAILQEQEAIQALQQTQEAYAKADKLRTEADRDTRWVGLHAEDLKDAVRQLQTALQQLDTNLMWLSPAGPATNSTAPREVEVARVQAQGTLHRVLDKTPVELSIGKDGQVEATRDGKKVHLDSAAKRQIKRHIEQALRLIAQEDK